MSITAITSASVSDYAALAAAGDEEAFSALYERFADPLLREITLRTYGNITVAEDIAGTVWERVARSIHGFEERGSGFPAWLFTIARTCVKEHYRTMKRRPELLDGDMLALDRPAGGDDLEDLVAQRMLNQQVAAAVNGLRADQRRCLYLRFYVSLTLAETADVMGRNVNAVKQLQLRALRTLRKRLGDLPDGGYDAVTRVGATAFSTSRPLSEAEGIIR